MYDIEKASQAQKSYCYNNHFPYLVPYSGKCWHCHKNVYAEGGISVEEASKDLVTFCPYCNAPFHD